MRVSFPSLCGVVVVLTGFFAGTVAAEEKDAVTPDEIREAIEAAIPLLENGARVSAEKRSCFTCHNQGMPLLALSEAKLRGFPVNEENFKTQMQHTWKHLNRGKDGYLKGKGQGGRVLTAGYALWALNAGGHRPDETTAAVVSYLVDYQQDQGHYRHTGKRPPSSGSDFTATYVGLYGLDFFGTRELQEKIEARRNAIAEWVEKTPAKDNEDRVFRLLLLRDLGSEAAVQKTAAQELVDQQQPDGGWRQTDDMPTDVYATGSALAALLISNKAEYTCEHPVIKRGLRYLLDQQKEDGSWHVVTRAKGFQTYYESGFPHKKDQFISMAASSWATLALTLSLPAK